MSLLPLPRGGVKDDVYATVRSSPLTLVSVSSPSHLALDMSTSQPSNVCPHIKDPVVTAYPGQGPDDVKRMNEGNTTIEYMPASMCILSGF